MSKINRKYENNININNINMNNNIKHESEIKQISHSVISENEDIFSTFINYDNECLESKVTLYKCIYDFSIKHLFEYVVYNVKSIYKYETDMILLAFLSNKNENIILRYLINFLLSIGMFLFMYTLIKLIVFYIIFCIIFGIISFILSTIIFPFKLIYNLLFKRNRNKDEDNENKRKGSKFDRNNKQDKIKNNVLLKNFLNLVPFYKTLTKSKKNKNIDIEQEIVLNFLENKNKKKLSKIKVMLLKLFNKLNVIFIKLNKKLQIKFIDNKVKNHDKHNDKKTKATGKALSTKDKSKDKANTKDRVIKRISSIVKKYDKSSHFNPREKEKMKKAKDIVIKRLKNEIKSEKEKIKATKIILDKTKSKVKSDIHIKNTKSKENEKGKGKTKKKVR